MASDYPKYAPYQFAGNMPIAAIDSEGKNFIILTWRSRPGDQGHSALAIQNWKTVIENGIEKIVEDGYTIFEVYPEEDFQNIDAFKFDVGAVVEGKVTNYRVADRNGLLNFQPTGKKITGAVEFNSEPKDDLRAIEALNSMVTKVENTDKYELVGGENKWITKTTNAIKYSLIEGEKVDNCTFSCSSFAIKMSSVLYGIDEGYPELIEFSGKMRLGSTSLEIPVGKAILEAAYTPNIVFLIASFNKGAKVIEGKDVEANKTGFIYQISGGTAGKPQIQTVDQHEEFKN